MQHEIEPTIKLQVYLWTQQKANIITVTNNMTIKDIINHLDCNENKVVVFTCADIKSQTPITNFSKTLADYNKWHPEDKNCVNEIHIV